MLQAICFCYRYFDIQVMRHLIGLAKQILAQKDRHGGVSLSHFLLNAPQVQLPLARPRSSASPKAASLLRRSMVLVVTLNQLAISLSVGCNDASFSNSTKSISTRLPRSAILVACRFANGMICVSIVFS